MTTEESDIACIPDAEGWATEQWGDVDLGDARLEARSIRIAGRLAQAPAASLPMQIGDPADLKATYRLLHNENVTFQALSTPHWKATRQTAQVTPLVLFVQDITHLDFTHYAKSMDGLGPIGDGNGRGLLLHSTMAIAPQPRQVLGLVHQIIFKRVPVPKGQYRRKRPKAERESRVWTEAITAIGTPPPGTCWVIVADRAADDTTYLLACRNQGYAFCVRLAYEHCLMPPEPDHATLLTTARSWAPVAGKVLNIRGKGGRPARQARLLISFGQVCLRVPKKQAPFSVWVVRVWEPEPPAGVEPLEWFLATNVAVDTAADAFERIDWYTMRWVAEDYHQCLKTGCALEQRDLEHADRIERLIGFLAPVAARLLQLRDAARLDADRPARDVVDPLLVTLLAHRLKLESAEMTVKAFWRGVAQLGGFLGRRRDGEPGWKILWRGWMLLQTLADGARLARSLSPP